MKCVTCSQGDVRCIDVCNDVKKQSDLHRNKMKFIGIDFASVREGCWEWRRLITDQQFQSRGVITNSDAAHDITSRDLNSLSLKVDTDTPNTNKILHMHKSMIKNNNLSNSYIVLLLIIELKTRFVQFCKKKKRL